MQEIALLSRHNNLFSLLHLSLYIIYNRRESDSNDTKYIIIFMLATAWARGLALSPSLIGCCCNSIKITTRWFFKCHKNRENSLLKKRETARDSERESEKYTYQFQFECLICHSMAIKCQIKPIKRQECRHHCLLLICLNKPH